MRTALRHACAADWLLVDDASAQEAVRTAAAAAADGSGTAFPSTSVSSQNKNIVSKNTSHLLGTLSPENSVVLLYLNPSQP